MKAWDGLLNVLKPPGMTSHDVVAWVRRQLKIKRVGHCGTLDPAAAGVLPLLLGRATRLAQYLPGDKEYLAEITFGRSTDSGDALGCVVSEKGARNLTASAVEALLPHFTGTIPQIPPMTSAVKVGGRKLYELARRGEEVERPARMVNIYRLRLREWVGEKSAYPRAWLEVSCSAGTYVRVLCQQLGEKLGCGAYMSFLLRTRAGNCSLKEAFTLEEVEAVATSNKPELVLSPGQMLSHLPSLFLTLEETRAVSRGQPIKSAFSSQDELQPGTQVALKYGDELVAVGEIVLQQSELIIQPRTVLTSF